MQRQVLRIREFCSSPCVWSAYINYLEFCTGDLSFVLHSFIYSVIYFFKCMLLTLSNDKLIMFAGEVTSH